MKLEYKIRTKLSSSTSGASHFEESIGKYGGARTQTQMSNDGVHSYQDHYDEQQPFYHRVDITFTADSHPPSLTAVTALFLTPLTSKDSPQSARQAS